MQGEGTYRDRVPPPMEQRHGGSGRQASQPTWRLTGWLRWTEEVQSPAAAGAGALEPGAAGTALHCAGQRGPWPLCSPGRRRRSAVPTLQRLGFVAPSWPEPVSVASD